MGQTERETLFHELRTLSDALSPVSPENPLSFNLYGMTVTVSFCDGRIMLLLWDYAGTEPTTFPRHIHKGTIETIGLLHGGKFVCVLGDNVTVLSQPGDSIVIPADTPHQVFCEPGDGPCSGWAVLAPPEQNFVLREEEGRKGFNEPFFCLLHRSGRCAASALTAADCVKLKLISVE